MTEKRDPFREYKSYEPSEGTPSESWKDEEAERKLGFVPDIQLSVSGTTFTDEESGTQRGLLVLKAGALVSKYSSIPILLQHDTENRFDKDAVKVILPTEDDPTGKLSVFRQVGFIPRKVCPKCHRSLTGKRSRDNICGCGELLDAKSRVNTRLVEELGRGFKVSSVPPSEDIRIGLLWISQSSTDRNPGVKLGIRFREKLKNDN